MRQCERESSGCDWIRLQTPLTLLLLLHLLDSFLMIFNLIILYFKSLLNPIHLPWVMHFDICLYIHFGTWMVVVKKSFRSAFNKAESGKKKGSLQFRWKSLGFGLRAAAQRPLQVSPRHTGPPAPEPCATQPHLTQADAEQPEQP